MKPTVIHECFPYRFIQLGELENGKPDYRIQKYREDLKRYTEMYQLDNSMQLSTCLDDPEYVKWLDPDGVPCYVKDRVTRNRL